MSEIKHTPGPWRVIEERDGYAVTTKARIGVEYIANEICQGRDGGKADAKLIAATPEMLQAGELLISAINDFFMFGYVKHEGLVKEAIVALSKVHKKATE